MPHSNEVLLREYVDAWVTGDVEKAESFYAENCNLHHFGRNPLAGDYLGKEAMKGYIKKLLEIGDKAQILEVYDVFGNDNGGVAVLHVRHERAGKKPLEGKRVTLVQIGDDRKIHDIWVRDEDQYAADEFFS